MKKTIKRVIPTSYSSLLKIKRALWYAISILTAFGAAMITILIIGLCWMQFSLYFSVGLAAIILYFLIPKRWGVFGISMSIIFSGLYILFIMVSGIFYQPLNCLMSSCLSICAVYAILKNREHWQWLAVMGIFLIAGAFCLFHNDIIGPMEFMIRDMPIDMPSQWLHCYRFFWAGIFIKMSTFSASILSILFLFIVSIYKRHMDILKTFYESVKLGL